MRSEWIDLVSVPESVAGLLSEAEMDCVELGLNWFSVIANHALDGDESARLLCAFDQTSSATVVLPLKLSRVSKTAFSLTNFYTSIYAPALAPGDQSSALSALFQRLRFEKWSMLQFSPLRRGFGVLATEPTLSVGVSLPTLEALPQADSGFELMLSSLDAAGWRPFSYFCFGNWYLPVDGRSFATYFAQLPSRVRNTVMRREKKFLRANPGRLDLVTDTHGIESAIETWTRIYNSSWKKPEPYVDFMPALIRICAAKGWLRMGIAWLADEPIAAQIWIVAGQRASIYKLAYVETRAQHGAGTILTAFLMRHVLDIDKVHEVDYLIGDDAYKKDWMTHRRERWGIVAYNPRTLRGLLGWIREVGGRWFKRLTR